MVAREPSGAGATVVSTALTTSPDAGVQRLRSVHGVLHSLAPLRPVAVAAVAAVLLLPSVAVAEPLSGEPLPSEIPPGEILFGVSAPGAAAQERRDPADTLAVRPVPGRVVRPFEAPDHAYGPGHRGVDLAAEPGDPVRAALAGRVTFAGQVAGVGWVTLDHGGGLRTTYGDITPAVHRGEAVAMGERIGVLVAGHLDWGARLDGDYLDPLHLLARWRAHLTRAG